MRYLLTLSLLICGAFAPAGYPDKWRDYGALEVRRADFLGNVTRAAAFESRRQLGKIGKPVDRDDWGMTPPTVNAYYNPSMNDMNFRVAGILLPPLYDPRLDAAPNYGNTGSTRLPATRALPLARSRPSLTWARPRR